MIANDEITNPAILQRIDVYEHGIIQPTPLTLEDVKALINTWVALLHLIAILMIKNGFYLTTNQKLKADCSQLTALLALNTVLCPPQWILKNYCYKA